MRQTHRWCWASGLMELGCWALEESNAAQHSGVPTGTEHPVGCESPVLQSRPASPRSLSFPFVSSPQMRDVNILLQFSVGKSERSNCLASPENSFRISFALAKLYKHFAKPLFSPSKKPSVF